MIELLSVAHAGSGSTGDLFAEIDLAVAGGDRIAISGATGVGKTTLLRVASGLERPRRGRVKLFDREVARLRRSSQLMLRRRLGLIPQTLELIPDASALDNVTLALDVCRVPRAQARARAAGALAEMGLAESVDRLTRAMSVGERQRVAIARALAREPMIIVGDEPTSHLDSSWTATVLRTLSRAADRGAAVVVAVNDSVALRLVGAAGWTCLTLRDGRLRAADASDSENLTGNVVRLPVSRSERSAGAAAPASSADDLAEEMR